MRPPLIALALCAIAATVAAPAALRPAHAAPVIELVELPTRLELPLASGTNRLFAVKIPGEPTAVWMATSADAETRLPLQPMGGKWVFNLGDPRVAEVVAGARQFQVFATVGGETGGSLPVQFVAAHAASVGVGLVDREGVDIGDFGWADPDRADRVVVTWIGAGVREPLSLIAGDVRVELKASGDTVSHRIDAPLRAAWRAAGALKYTRTDGEAVTLARPIPTTLPSEARAPIRVVQRRSRVVPGSEGYLIVRLGDISGTRVPLTLTGVDGTLYIDQRLLTQGDRAEFALGSARYVVVVDRLVNMMFGEDHAELHIEPAAAALTTPAPR